MSFQPRYIFECELARFGLPTEAEQRDILTLVDRASVLIDEHCGRLNVDGHGSLVYSTYTERLILPEGRNILRLSYRPLVSVSATVQQNIAASGAQAEDGENFYDTGVVANTVESLSDSVLSPVVSARGRYGYRRRGEAPVYPEANYGINPLQLASFFGGPPQFTDIDIQNIDFDARTGEVWLPAGLYLAQYSEVEMTYNSGFHPLDMPNAIKQATAALVLNMLVRPASGVRGFSGVGRMSMNFTEDYIDDTVERWLRNYKVVIAH
jgi:hypothetical protein